MFTAQFLQNAFHYLCYVHLGVWISGVSQLADKPQMFPLLSIPSSTWPTQSPCEFHRHAKNSRHVRNSFMFSCLILGAGRHNTRKHRHIKIGVCYMCLGMVFCCCSLGLFARDVWWPSRSLFAFSTSSSSSSYLAAGPGVEPIIRILILHVIVT